MRVHQIENSRVFVDLTYIQKFLTALNYTRADFDLACGKRDPEMESKRDKCHVIINSLDRMALEKTFDSLLKV